MGSVVQGDYDIGLPVWMVTYGRTLWTDMIHPIQTSSILVVINMKKGVIDSTVFLRQPGAIAEANS